MKDVIKRIISSDELAGDILRVLTIFNNVLWESEILWEVQGMNSTLNVEVDLSKLGEKLKDLEKEGVITMDTRIKGSISGENKEENLVKLLYPSDTIDVLRSDNKFIKYIEARRSAYEKYLK